MLMYRPNENFMCLVQILLWYNRTYVYKTRNNFKLIFHYSTLFVFHANIFISPNFFSFVNSNDFIALFGSIFIANSIPNKKSNFLSEVRTVH